MDKVSVKLGLLFPLRVYNYLYDGQQIMEDICRVNAFAWMKGFSSFCVLKNLNTYQGFPIPIQYSS